MATTKGDSVRVDVPLQPEWLEAVAEAIYKDDGGKDWLTASPSTKTEYRSNAKTAVLCAFDALEIEAAPWDPITRAEERRGTRYQFVSKLLTEEETDLHA